MDHNYIYNLFLMAYGNTTIINYSVLAYSALILSKFIYSFLKKKSKFSNFCCLLLTIISIFPLCFFVTSNDLSSNNINFIF